MILAKAYLPRDKLRMLQDKMPPGTPMGCFKGWSRNRFQDARKESQVWHSFVIFHTVLFHKTKVAVFSSSYLFSMKHKSSSFRHRKFFRQNKSCHLFVIDGFFKKSKIVIISSSTRSNWQFETLWEKISCASIYMAIWSTRATFGVRLHICNGYFRMATFMPHGVYSSERIVDLKI